MRNVLRTGVVCLGLVLATAPVRAQGLTKFLQPGQRAATFSSGSTRSIVNQPVDTSLAIAPFPGQRTSSYLPSFFRNISLPSFPTGTGSSPLPPPEAFPSTRYPDFKPAPYIPANPQQPRRWIPFNRSDD